MNGKVFFVSMLVAASLNGCSGPSASVSAGAVQSPSGTAKSGSYTTQWVQLVIFENESYEEVIGNPQAPYLTGLATTWADMTDSHAVTHPSQPNYLALFSGSTQGVTGDNCPVNFQSASLGSELVRAGISFTAFAESMPKDGFEGCQAHPDKLPSGWLYMRKHVPWADFKKIPKKDSVVYRHVLSAPPSRFVWITPNMCNDMHDCPIATGDKWAAKNLPKLIAWDRANDGVLIVTWDENDGTYGNQIPTILAGNVVSGRFSQDINHYSVLRTIEDIFGVKALGNAATATPIQGVIK